MDILSIQDTIADKAEEIRRDFEIWITKDKKLAAKIVPIERKSRQLGLLDNSDFWIADDFDAPDKSIEALFYGEKE